MAYATGYMALSMVWASGQRACRWLRQLFVVSLTSASVSMAIFYVLSGQCLSPQHNLTSKPDLAHQG